MLSHLGPPGGPDRSSTHLTLFGTTYVRTEYVCMYLCSVYTFVCKYLYVLRTDVRRYNMIYLVLLYKSASE